MMLTFIPMKSNEENFRPKMRKN